jgi:HEAT repeat protein
VSDDQRQYAWYREIPVSPDKRKKMRVAEPSARAPKAAEDALARLDHPDPEVRAVAVQTLANDKRTITAQRLVDILRSGSRTAQLAVIAVMQRRTLKHVDADVALIQVAASDDEDVAVRQAAIEMLGRRRDRDAVADLTVLLDHPVLGTPARTALKAISGDAVEKQAARLRSRSAKERRIGASQLGELEDIAGFAYLLPLLRDPEVAVKTEAARALRKILYARTGPRRALLDDTPPDVYVAMQERWSVQDRPFAAQLLAFADEPDATVASWLFPALVYVWGPDVLEAMKRILADPAHHSFAAAITAIGEAGDVRGVDVLTHVARSGADYVRRRAIEALGNIDDMSAVRALLLLLREPDPRIRGLAAAQLQSKSWADHAIEPIVAGLLPLLADSDNVVRATAISGLYRAQRGYPKENLPSSFPQAIANAASDSEPKVRIGALDVSSLILSPPEFEIVLCRALDDPDLEVRQKAANWIHTGMSGRVVEALRSRAMIEPDAEFGARLQYMAENLHA